MTAFVCACALMLLLCVATAEDLSDEDLDTVLNIAKEAFSTSPAAGQIYSSIASIIRTQCDKELGRGWSCVVGRRFGAFVTQRIKAYGYFSVVPGVCVLVWKA